MLIRLALRNLARHGRRTLLTVMALAIGVGAITGVRGFLNGLQGALVRGVSEGGIGALQLHRTGFMSSRDGLPLSPSVTLDEAFLAQLMAVEGVRAVSPRIPFAGLVADSTGDKSGLAILQGVDPGREGMVSRQRRELVEAGTWPKGPGEGAMSVELAKALGVTPGQKVAVLANDRDGVLNGVEVTVTATLAAPTMAEKKLLIMPLTSAQEVLRMDGQITEVAVGLHDGVDVDDVAARLQPVLGADWELHTWKQLMPFADDARRTQNAALSIVTVAFLFIVLMGVANTLLMNVLERTREIGTLLALGMKRGAVLRLFLLEGALTAALGVVVGSALGAAVVVAFSDGVMLHGPGTTRLQRIVPFLTPEFTLGLLAVIVVGAVVASFLPSFRASRLDPVAALTDR
jgi:putative ABC transport system permease protein